MDGKHVRMPVIRGGWILQPTATGGTHIVYTVLSEPGGSLPAFLARGAQVDTCRDLIVETLEIAAAHPELSIDR